MIFRQEKKDRLGSVRLPLRPEVPGHRITQPIVSLLSHVCTYVRIN